MANERRNRDRLYPLSMRVRWTRRERNTVQKRAKDAGRSLSRYLVECATREEGAPLLARLQPQQVETLESLLFQLHKVGVNLNQLAHRENAADYGTADPPTDEEILTAVRELRQICARIRAVLTEGSP